MPVVAVENPFLGFPRSGGRVLGVHGFGSFHRRFFGRENIVDTPPMLKKIPSLRGADTSWRWYAEGLPCVRSRGAFV
jgi:hypothetical protein